MAELSTLPSNGPLPTFVILDNIKPLALRVVGSFGTDEIMEVISDVEILEHNAIDQKAIAALQGVSVRMNSKVALYMDPTLEAYTEFLADDPFYPIRTVTLSMLLEVAAALLKPDEEVTSLENKQLFINYSLSGPNNFASTFYDLTSEITFLLPKKSRLSGGRLRHLPKDVFLKRWKYIELEWHIRRDSVNHIRKLEVNHTQPPGQNWNLTVEQYYEDLMYLRKIYREASEPVLRLRWVWGRKLWTLFARRWGAMCLDEEDSIRDGRSMEMKARRNLFKLGILSSS